MSMAFRVSECFRVGVPSTPLTFPAQYLPYIFPGELVVNGGGVARVTPVFGRFRVNGSIYLNVLLFRAFRRRRQLCEQTFHSTGSCCLPGCYSCYFPARH